MEFSRKFISATTEYCTYEKYVPAPYIRKSFNITSDIKNAEITICGLGFYELYINGNKITKGLLAPYISASDDIIFYDNYNIKNYLKNGENVM
jgi:alpha-L-rhamnosidase